MPSERPAFRLSTDWWCDTDAVTRLLYVRIALLVGVRDSAISNWPPVLRAPQGDSSFAPPPMSL